MTEVFDFSAIHQQANAVAREEEENARSLLWQRVSAKAVEDPSFKQRLLSAPEKVIELEARGLTDASGKHLDVPSSLVEDVAKKAQSTFSSAIGEIDLGQVTEMVFGTIKDIRHSFNVTLVLSQVLFYAGLAMVAAAFVLALVTDKQWISVLFGASGIGSVLISSFVLGPLDRIRDAAGNLIQLQMAYLGYYNQLYLLGGGRKLARDEAFEYAKQIDRAALSMMQAVQTCVEEPRDPKPPPPAANQDNRASSEPEQKP